MTVPKVLGISGSLKTTSTNTRLLKAIAALIDTPINFLLYEGLEEIPAFNPDKEEGNRAVSEFKAAINAADAVIICTPEYAFGVPGVLKNALDWTVHTGNFNQKPVMLISCSPLYDGANKAMASLLLTLGALGTTTGNLYLSIGNSSKKISASGEITDEDLRTQLKKLVMDLLNNTTSR